MKTLLKIGLGMLGLATVLVVLGSVFGVLHAQSGGGNRTGSHAMRSEPRQVGADVVTIELNGPIDLMLKQGATPSLVVYGEERLLPLVKTEQQGSVLSIDLKSGFPHIDRPLRVDLTLPALQQLTVHGSGDSIVSGFSGDKLTLAMHGSGDVRFNGEYQHVVASLLGSGDLDLALGTSSDLDLSMLGSGSITASGRSSALAAHMMGSGNLGAEKMLVETVRVDLMGSGDATLFAGKVAILDVKGSGDIDVHGNPQHREVNRAGSGDISWDSN